MSQILPTEAQLLKLRGVAMAGLKRMGSDGAVPEADLAQALDQALASVRVESSLDPMAHDIPNLETVIIDGPDRVRSVKAYNVVLNPMGWVDIAWQAASVWVAVKDLGAWCALGVALLLRDLLRQFEVELTPTHGRVLLLLRALHRAGAVAVPLEKVAVSLNADTSVGLDEKTVDRLVDDLARVKCVQVDRERATVRLIEKIVIR